MSTVNCEGRTAHTRLSLYWIDELQLLEYGVPN
jgi:hypothetical protein